MNGIFDDLENIGKQLSKKKGKKEQIKIKESHMYDPFVRTYRRFSRPEVDSETLVFSH